MSEDSVVLTHIKYIVEKVDRIEKVLDGVAAKTDDQETRITVLTGQVVDVSRKADTAEKNSKGIIYSALLAFLSVASAIAMWVIKK